MSYHKIVVSFALCATIANVFAMKRTYDNVQLEPATKKVKITEPTSQLDMNTILNCGQIKTTPKIKTINDTGFERLDNQQFATINGKISDRIFYRPAKATPRVFNTDQDQIDKFYKNIEDDDERAVRADLMKGMNPNERHPQFGTPLCYAICHNNPHILEPLFEYGANPNQQDAATKIAPLHFAVAESLKLVRILVQNGGDLNIETKRKITPLITAVQEGRVYATKMLIGMGANTSIIDENGMAALDHADDGNSHKQETIRNLLRNERRTILDWNFDQNLFSFLENREIAARQKF